MIAGPRNHHNRAHLPAQRQGLIWAEAVRTLATCFPAHPSSDSACRALEPASRIGSPRLSTDLSTVAGKSRTEGRPYGHCFTGQPTEEGVRTRSLPTIDTRLEPVFGQGSQFADLPNGTGSPRLLAGSSRGLGQVANANQVVDHPPQDQHSASCQGILFMPGQKSATPKRREAPVSSAWLVRTAHQALSLQHRRVEARRTGVCPDRPRGSPMRIRDSRPREC